MQGRGIRFSIVAIILGWLLASFAIAGEGARVSSVTESREPGTGRPVVDLWGKGLGTIVGFDLTDPSGPTLLEAPAVIQRTGSRIVLGLPLDLPPGSYEVGLRDKKGQVLTVPVSVGNGKPLPGTVEAGALSAELRADLDDAETLNGNPGSYFLDAGNLSGVLSTGRYSAYGDLAAEGKIGTGAAQVAAGDHTHADYLTATQASSSFSTIDHSHAGLTGAIGARVYRSTPFTVTDQSTVHIPFDTEAHDTDGCYDKDSNAYRLICRTSGYYIIGARVNWDGTAATVVRIRKNGSTAAISEGGGKSQEVSTVEYLAIDDYIEVQVTVTTSSGYSLDALGGSTRTSLYMMRMGQ